MKAIIGGDNPKTALESMVHDFKYLIDWSKVNLPKYNPYQFMLCRNLNGDTKKAFAAKTKLPYKRYCEIENGDVVPTDNEVVQCTQAQTHVVKTFFEKWPETTIDFSKAVPVPVAIDYYKYQVFSEINPKMTIV